jgi:competence protein ComEC
VTFFAVGHGDAVLLSSGGEHALVDGGGEAGGRVGERHVLPALQEEGVRRLQLAVLSHPHADHALGLAEVLERIPTEQVWLSSGLEHEPLARRVARASPGAAVSAVFAGWPPFQLGEATLTVESPPVDPTALRGENNRSVVLRVRHRDVQLLLTGDIEAPAEAQLPLAPVQVLKAPHHGSATSSGPGFIAALHPRFVVFCVAAGGRFHFPQADVARRYAEAGVRCLRTDWDGAIRFVSDGRDVHVLTYRRRDPADLTRSWLPLPDDLATLEGQ